MMAHAGGRFGGQQVAAGGLEELHGHLVLERGRVRHVDDDLGVCKRLGQPLAGDGVDARGRRCRQRRHDPTGEGWSRAWIRCRPLPPITTIFIALSPFSDRSHRLRSSGRTMHAASAGSPCGGLEFVLGLSWRDVQETCFSQGRSVQTPCPGTSAVLAVTYAGWQVQLRTPCLSGRRAQAITGRRRAIHVRRLSCSTRSGES